LGESRLVLREKHDAPSLPSSLPHALPPSLP
jgi:hypothetical protein